MDELIRREDSTPVLRPLSKVAKALLPKAEKMTDAYLEATEDSGGLFSVVGLARKGWGISQQTFNDWVDRAREGDDRFAPALVSYKKIRDLSLLQLHDAVYKRNASGSMFLLKSMHGYRDHDSAASAKAGGSIVININTGVSAPQTDAAARTIDVRVEPAAATYGTAKNA